MSTPSIPPRPTRANAGPTAVKDNSPQVPPRPSRSRLEPSPAREEYSRSPLNDLPEHSKRPSGHIHPSDVPARPPSVNLPSIGQEGDEYAHSYDQLPADAHGVKNGDSAPEQTRNVSPDMPMHAPRASVPMSMAKSRISAVTRTDSSQAAAAGIGKPGQDRDGYRSAADSSTSLNRASSGESGMRRARSNEPRPYRNHGSAARSNSSLPHGASSKPESVHDGEHDEEQGIPEIGMQIPLYPNAGDVQAPSPAQTQSQHAPGVGFFNDGSTRAHHRKRSSRHEFGPQGSYGLHGHGGEAPHDQFERDWQRKHPEEAAQEGYNVYGNFITPRPETALSSAELNKLVNQNSDLGMGTSPSAIGTPDQNVAFEATDEYNRIASPRPSTRQSPGPAERKKRSSSGAHSAVESPLRKTSFPAHETQHMRNNAVEGHDDLVIHVDPPEKGNKVTGGGPPDTVVDFGPSGGNTEEEGGWVDERGEGTPILASDEILKRPGSAFMQPAVNPEEKADDEYYDSDHSPEQSRRNSQRLSTSRPTSRPGSMHGEYTGGSLHRFMSHEETHGSGMGTPLEEIEEYEPLFPEDEKDQPKPKPWQKRPGLEHHHFPSQDTWEDTPSSLQYQTTVQTPEPPRESREERNGASASEVFESPEQEQRRRTENTHDMTSDSKTFAKPHFKPGVQEQMDYHHRPGVNRFPSQDIWEDTPDSMRLQTTVSGPQMEEVKSPEDERPTTQAIPTSQDDGTARATTGFGQVRHPSIPERPQRRSKLAEEVKPDDAAPQQDDPRSKGVPDLGARQPSPDKAKAPAIPDRPKPTVPARPARPARTESAEKTAADAPAPKPKPAVPARPAAADKFASVKQGFMSDLNARLKVGPQHSPPKDREPAEPEFSAEAAPKAPLEDARKGRARGPPRRRPAPTAAAVAEEVKSVPQTFGFSIPCTVWETDADDRIVVPSSSGSGPAVEAKDSSVPAPEPSPPTTSATAPAEALAAAEDDDEPLSSTSPDNGRKFSLPELEQVLSENEAQNTEEPTLVQPPSSSPEQGRAVVPHEAEGEGAGAGTGP